MARDRFDHNVDHSDVNKPVRSRVEVLTGVERRRRWSAREKLEIVAESLAEGAVVSDIARRHGIRPQQLFGWRAKVRAEMAAQPPEPPSFAPVLIDTAVTRKTPPALRPDPPDDVSLIEIVLGAAIVRVRGAVDARSLAAVLKALKVLS